MKKYKNRNEEIALLDNQAARVVQKFGGSSRRMAEAIKRCAEQTGESIPRISNVTIERWALKGNGFIPAPAMPHVLRAARYEGIIILPEDLYKLGDIGSRWKT